MSKSLKINASKRSLTGRKVKQLRQAGKLPANIYGKDVKSTAVELGLKEFQAVFKQAGETNVIDLVLDKESKPRPVLISNIQLNPVTDALLHVDFRQVDLTQKVTVSVPLVFKGESPAVIQGGVLVKVLNEIQIEALPKDLPDNIEIDITGLDSIGQGITVKQLPVDSAKVKVLVDNLEELVVKIESPTKEEEVPAPAPAAEAQAETPTETSGTKKAEPEAKPQKADQDKKPAANKS